MRNTVWKQISGSGSGEECLQFEELGDEVAANVQMSGGESVAE